MPQMRALPVTTRIAILADIHANLPAFEAVISDARPALFVEVDTGNDAAFRDWCRDRDYSVTFEARHQAANVNYFVQSASAEGTSC